MKRFKMVFLTCSTGLLLLYHISASAQQNEPQSKLLFAEAEQLYTNKEYLKSGQKYSEALAGIKPCRVDDWFYHRFSAACSWALAGEKDSAFVQLLRIAKEGFFPYYRHIADVTDLISLHDDKRWAEFIEIIKKSYESIDLSLWATLDTVYNTDQTYLNKCIEIEKQEGLESNAYKEALKISLAHNSTNLVIVEKILAEYGWLGIDKVGTNGNTALWLVIQHSNINVQEKYLPMIKEAVSKRKATPEHLAMLEDRIALRHGDKQIYGSQINKDPETGLYFVMPLIDPDNVNKRRFEVCMEPLQEYLISYKITWDVEAYKKELPSIEEKMKTIKMY